MSGPDEHGVEDEPDRLEAEAEARDGAWADPLRQRRRGAAGEQRADGGDGERRPGLERGEAEDALEVERDREHEPELTRAPRSAPRRSRRRSCVAGRAPTSTSGCAARRSIARNTTRNSAENAKANAIGDRPASGQSQPRDRERLIGRSQP